MTSQTREWRDPYKQFRIVFKHLTPYWYASASSDVVARSLRDAFIRQSRDSCIQLNIESYVYIYVYISFEKYVNTIISSFFFVDNLLARIIYTSRESLLYGQHYRDLLPITDFWEKYGLFGIRINFKALPRIQF